MSWRCNIVFQRNYICTWLSVNKYPFHLNKKSVLIWAFKGSNICSFFICIGINVSNRNWRNLPWNKSPKIRSHDLMAIVTTDGVTRQRRLWSAWHFHDLLLEGKERKEKQSEWRKEEGKHALFHPSCLERLLALLSSFGAELRCLSSKIKPEKKLQEDPPSRPPPAGLAGVILLRLLRSALRYVFF